MVVHIGARDLVLRRGGESLLEVARVRWFRATHAGGWGGQPGRTPLAAKSMYEAVAEPVDPVLCNQGVRASSPLAGTIAPNTLHV